MAHIFTTQTRSQTTEVPRGNINYKICIVLTAGLTIQTDGLEDNPIIVYTIITTVDQSMEASCTYAQHIMTHIFRLSLRF